MTYSSYYLRDEWTAHFDLKLQGQGQFCNRFFTCISTKSHFRTEECEVQDFQNFDPIVQTFSKSIFIGTLLFLRD